MKAKEFLEEYETRNKRKTQLLSLKKQAIAEVRRIDDEYWSNRSKKLREKYKTENKIPKDHPLYIERLKDIWKMKNGHKRIV